MNQLPFLDQSELDQVAKYCYNQKMSFQRIKAEFKKDGYRVAVKGTTKSLGKYGTDAVVNRVRGIALAKNEGKVPEWFEEPNGYKVDE